MIYINGQEALRIGMNDGNFDSSTFANRTVSDAVYEGPFELPGELLLAGPNLVAVEVHQTNANSSDVVFGLSLDLVTATQSDNLPIYYTLDGADPRLPGGAVNTDSARLYTGPITLVRSVDVKARTTDGVNWSALAEASFIVGTASVLELRDSLTVTEVMYNPPAGDEFEFLELHNISDSLELVLGGCAFTNGIDFVFPEQTSIPPGGYLIVTPADELAFREEYGVSSSVNIVGPYTGKLSNGGEGVELSASADGATIFEFSYSDGRGWPCAADGAGHSIVPGNDEVIAMERDGSLEYGGNWRASSFQNGSPGREDPAPIRDITLNEFQANTADAPGASDDYASNDWIEIYNTTSSDIVLRDWHLSDDADELMKWALPVIEIPANGSLVFDEITGFHYPADSGFALNQDGEQLFLSHLPGAGADRVADCVDFKAQEPDRTLGRFPDGGEYWQAMPPTQGAPNAGPFADIVINELMYHAPTLAGGIPSAEYIELVNPTDGDVNLWNDGGPWRLDGGVEYLFPENTVIPAGGTLLVADFDPSNAYYSALFHEDYSVPGDSVQILGPYNGQLSDGGERIALERALPPETPDGGNSWVIIDEVIYFDRAPFPLESDGDGQSLHRQSLTLSGNDPANWISDAPSPGVYTPVDIGGWALY